MWKFILVELVILIALYTDLKYNKIYNKLIFPAAIIGVVLNFNNMTQSLIGFLLVIAAYIPVYMMGAAAAGDVKILMVIAVILEYKFTIYAILIIVFVNLVITSVILIKNKNFKNVLKDTFLEIKYRILILFQHKKAEIFTKPHIQPKTQFPYMPSVAIGVNITFLLKYLLHI